MDDLFDRIVGDNRSTKKVSSTITTGIEGEIIVQEGDFIPSNYFIGKKPGYKFQKGHNGIGYYYDSYQDKNAISRKRKLDNNNNDLDNNNNKRTREDVEDNGDKEEDDDEEEELNDEELLAKALAGDEIDEETLQKLLSQVGDDADVVELDLQGLKQSILSFEKKINTNQKLRVKYPDEPMKFLDSEMELDDEIKKLEGIAAAPDLIKSFVELNAVKSLLGLVSHENTDISITSLNCLKELTAIDVITEDEEAICIVTNFVKESGLELIVQNLERLDEQNESDAKGVYATLNIIENLLFLNPTLSVIICEKTEIMIYLLKRLKIKKFDKNKLYCSEIFAILLSADAANQKKLAQIHFKRDQNGLDFLLEILSVYRKKNPQSPEEEECVENLFDCLSTALLLSENQSIFRHSEGFALMAKCMKEKKYAASCAVRVIDYAIQDNFKNCEEFVKHDGFKNIFPAFMTRGWYKEAKKTHLKGEEREACDKSIVSILASICLYCTERNQYNANERLIGKFIEFKCEKVERLIEQYMKYSDKVAAEEERIINDFDDSDEEVEQAIRYQERLSCGLDILEKIVIIIAHICSQSKECREYVFAKFYQENRSIGGIRKILKMHSSQTDPDPDPEEDEENGEPVKRNRVSNLKQKLLIWAKQLMEETSYKR